MTECLPNVCAQATLTNLAQTLPEKRKGHIPHLVLGGDHHVEAGAPGGAWRERGVTSQPGLLWEDRLGEHRKVNVFYHMSRDSSEHV